jgi:hypothetical protein
MVGVYGITSSLWKESYPDDNTMRFVAASEFCWSTALEDEKETH